MQGIGFMPANVGKILKLEIDKRLQVGGDELVNHEDDDDAHQNHHGDGHLGEPETIAPLELLRQPMNHHADHDEDEHIAIVPCNFWNLIYIPMAAHLVDHVFGGVPSGFVGHSRVEVGAAAEEESREGDEGESSCQ